MYIALVVIRRISAIKLCVITALFLIRKLIMFDYKNCFGPIALGIFRRPVHNGAPKSLEIVMFLFL